jgi:transcriptional regulator with XRE-family HTH domain
MLGEGGVIMPFGANLRELLLAKKMTVTELANKSGLNRGTIYSYLRRDTKKMDPEVIKKLVAVLGEDAYVLYDADDITNIIWDGLPKNVGPDEMEVIMKYRGLDDWGKIAVKAVLEAELSRCAKDKAEEK